jgi:hypothetical protein
MTEDRLTAAPDKETRTSPLRCREIARADRGWERCHLDEHNPSTRHLLRAGSSPMRGYRADPDRQ